MSDTITLLKLILNIIFIFIFNDSFIIRFLWGCVFFALFYSLWRLKKHYYLKIEDLHVMSLPITLCIIISYFIGFFCLLFIYKVLHISREVDLKQIYNIVKTFYKGNDYFLLFSTGFLFLSIFILGFIILAIIKAIIFKHFMRLDLLCINYYPLDVNRQDNPSPYDKFKCLFTESMNKVLHMFCYIKYLFPPHYRSSICQFIFNWNAYFGLFACILLVIYDIFFNNFVIHKLYYGLPFIFLYQLLQIMHRFQVMLATEENIICCLLYHNLVHYNAQEKIYYFSNNYFFNQEDLNEVIILVKCNFNRNLALKRIYENKQKSTHNE